MIDRQLLLDMGFQKHLGEVRPVRKGTKITDYKEPDLDIYIHEFAMVYVAYIEVPAEFADESIHCREINGNECSQPEFFDLFFDSYAEAVKFTAYVGWKE